MVEVVNINITPMRGFIGSIISRTKTELFLFENFTKYNKSKLIAEYYKMVLNTLGTYTINEEKLMHLVTVLDKVIFRNTPNINGCLKDYKVISMVESNSNMTIQVEYEFE